MLLMLTNGVCESLSLFCSYSIRCSHFCGGGLHMLLWCQGLTCARACRECARVVTATKMHT